MQPPSLAGDLGYSEPTIAALVRHKGHTITPRYVHAADAVADRTAALMEGAKLPAQVVELPARRAWQTGRAPGAAEMLLLCQPG